VAPIPIFLINLDRSPNRLALMRAQANASGLRFERVPAIDGTKELPTWATVQFLSPHGRVRAGLSEGEVGCYASHLLVFSKIIERRLEAAIVLEDDAVLDDEFGWKTLQAIRAAPAEWDCIHFSTSSEHSAFPVADLGSGHCLVRYMRPPVNSLAYAISLAGAIKLMAPRYRVRPFDVEFRLAWGTGLEIFGTDPALARPHEHLASAIDGDCKKERFEGWRRRNPGQQAQWKPGLASQIRGWFHVMHRLGFARALQSWNATPPRSCELSTKRPVGFWSSSAYKLSVRTPRSAVGRQLRRLWHGRPC
jgi:glycosyl transferase, family 25